MPDDIDPVEESVDGVPEPDSLDGLLADLTADGGEPAAQSDTGALQTNVADADEPMESLVESESDVTPAPDPMPTAAEAEAEGEVAMDPEAAPMPSGQADAGLVETVGGGLTWMPYAAYLGAWLVLAAASAYLLKDATPESPARWTPEYPAIVWTGVGLTALGPVLSLIVWLVARRRRPAAARRGLFVSALIRGALTAVFGVAIWAATIYVLELVATGVIS